MILRMLILQYSLYPKKGNWLDAAITKRMISSEPTRQIPCEDHDYGACRDIRGNAIIAEELGCKVPFELWKTSNQAHPWIP